MKNTVLLFVVMLLCITANAQEGVKFEELTFKEALAKAKAENKLVFMDCYTSWCGPCKKMLNTVFVKKEAGDFFNSRFVNVKYDMEKGEGIELAKQFNIKKFPTFFIFRPDGTIQHKIGGAGSLNSFLSWVERGLNEKTSLDYLNKLYEKGPMDKKQLLDYYRTLAYAGENEKSNTVLGELKGKLDTKDRLQPEYWFLLKERPYGSEECNFVVSNYSKLKENVGKETVDGYLESRYHKILDQVIQREGGNNEKTMKEFFERITKEWASMKWEPEKRLQNKMKLLQACLAQDSESIYACLDFGLNKQENPKWNFDVWVLLSALDFVNASGEKVDVQKLFALEERVSGYFSSSANTRKRVQAYFEKFR
ncbi:MULTISPECIES: thioredoxin family protein [Butyricimonas]|uniref:thioredoxin family protein n=1 Tax=Butyricimonas TaxID=574697 RepID=UPI001651C70F|nr:MULTISPECIES: thioredoxin family protein [Butyricimonas]